MRHISDVIFLMGPTASGKTTLAIELRKILPVELISVDSGLIYRGMDIGTAKPNSAELRIAPHRLVNILDATQRYSVAEFRRDALTEIDQIISTGRIPLLVGGTMLYFKALLKGLTPLPAASEEIREKIKKQAEVQGWQTLYKILKSIDPSSAIHIHPNDANRISRALEIFLISGKTLTKLKKVAGEVLPYQVHQFAFSPRRRTTLHQRIEKRFHQMLASGFEKEVRKLFSRGDLDANMPSMRCVGYRQMWSYLERKIEYNEMVYQSIRATKKLAKHQITWLRSWEGKIHWLDSEQPQQALKKFCRWLVLLQTSM